LHDWNEQSVWEGVRHLWITALLRWIKPRLPEGYRAYIGSVPTVAVGGPADRPDVGVRRWSSELPASATTESESADDAAGPDEPDEEIAVATLDVGHTLFVERRGFLIAAVELISPRNKDRPEARETYTARYAGYLLEGIHLLLIDVHRRPLNFSFANRIAESLQIRQPLLPPPMAVIYRVGEPAATGGRLLGIWRYPLTVGSKLPTVKLPLTTRLSVPVDLEETYQQAAKDAYLS
jgi:hypothetical protein